MKFRSLSGVLAFVLLLGACSSVANSETDTTGPKTETTVAQDTTTTTTEAQSTPSTALVTNYDKEREEALEKVEILISSRICFSNEGIGELLNANFIGIFASADKNESQENVNVGVATRFGEYLVTAKHLLGEFNTVRFVNNYGEVKAYVAEVIYTDLELDIALLRIPELAGSKDHPPVFTKEEFEDNLLISACFFQTETYQSLEKPIQPWSHLRFRSGVFMPYHSEDIVVVIDKIAKYLSTDSPVFSSLGNADDIFEVLNHVVILTHSVFIALNGSSGSAIIFNDIGEDGNGSLMGMMVEAGVVPETNRNYSFSYRFYEIIERIKSQTGIDLLNL